MKDLTTEQLKVLVYDKSHELVALQRWVHEANQEIERRKVSSAPSDSNVSEPKPA